MNEINNTQGVFFKMSFGDIEIAKDFLKNYLPKNVVEAVDLEHIEKENVSYADEEFQNTHSDLLWKTKKTTMKDIYTYYLSTRVLKTRKSYSNY